jgi:hypothetical protein
MGGFLDFLSSLLDKGTATGERHSGGVMVHGTINGQPVDINIRKSNSTGTAVDVGAVKHADQK